MIPKFHTNHFLPTLLYAVRKGAAPMSWHALTKGELSGPAYPRPETWTHWASIFLICSMVLIMTAASRVVLGMRYFAFLLCPGCTVSTQEVVIPVITITITSSSSSVYQRGTEGPGMWSRSSSLSGSIRILPIEFGCIILPGSHALFFVVLGRG